MPGTANGRDPAAGSYTIYSYLQPDYINGRHNGGINIGYCDGHVKWMKSENLLNHPEYWTP